MLLTEPPKALLDSLKSDPNKEVYYLAQTGEIFETYECASPCSFFHACLTVPAQGLCRTDVLLQVQTVPV